MYASNSKSRVTSTALRYQQNREPIPRDLRFAREWTRVTAVAGGCEEECGRAAGTSAPRSLGYEDEEHIAFTGHERDGLESQEVDHSHYLDYMHARYYNPNWGRFLSVDPTWESADLGSPQSWNRYAYVRNNPINATDPDGRNWVKAAYIGLKKVVAMSKRLDIDDGARLVKEGEDVLVSNRKTLEEVGRKASPDGSTPVIDKPHGPKEKGYRAHGHVVDAEGNRIKGMGHIFMSGVVGVVTALVPGMDADAANELDETNIGQRLNDSAGQLYEGKTWNDLDRDQQKAVLDHLRDQQERQQ